MEPLYLAAIFVDGLGYRCGTCGSADHWIETPTDVGCTRCGTLLPHDQLDAYYAYAETV